MPLSRAHHLALSHSPRVMRQVQPVPCPAGAEGVSGRPPMGRQPDDLGTPALAWLALSWWIQARSIPGDGEGELGRVAVALPVVVGRVVGQRAARPPRRSRYHRNPGTRLDVSWQRLQTCPQPSCRGQVPRLRVPNRLRVHVRDGLPFAFTARARIAAGIRATDAAELSPFVANRPCSGLPSRASASPFRATES